MTILTVAWLGVAWADAPSVAITWKGPTATLSVGPPAGHKLAEDAPATVVLRTDETEVEFRTLSAALTAGVAVGDRRGAAVEGELDVMLCRLDGTECRPTEWTFEGQVPNAKRGTAALEVHEHGGVGEADRFGPDVDTSAADAAFARARERGTPVLLDFSAVWCPPCNRLAADVIDGDPAVLEGFEWAVVDVDHPSSWALKSRYGVAGYPTVLVADADGTERTRTVGYEGKDAFVAWLQTAAGRNDGADLQRDPATVDPRRAAELAWLLASRGDTEAAAPWIALADPDTADLRLARAAVDHEPADVRWVVEHAPTRTGDLLWSLPGVAEKDPDLARSVSATLVADASGVRLAEALSVAAEVDPLADRKALLFAASASVLEGELTGDPEQDKGNLTELAELEEQAGDLAGALDRLARGAETWPDEMTFHLATASMLLRADRPAAALEAADRALAVAWGDNRLRAGIARCKALVALERSDAAADTAQKLLAEHPPPPDGIAVRTTRYRGQLEPFLAPPTNR